MEKVIYFVEDERTLDPYILDARTADLFPGWKVLACDLVDDAIEWSRKADAAVVFVVDSRMYMTPALKKALTKELKKRRIDFGDVTEGDIETLTGVLGTVLLRKHRPECRIIVLTAFARSIEEVRKANRALDALLDQTIDVMLSKSSPNILTETIRRQIEALQGA